MKRFLLIVYYLLLQTLVFGQGENNIWTFATAPAGNNTILNFSSGTPQLNNLASPYDNFGFGAAVCKPSGQLSFFVRLTPNNGLPAYNNIFESNGTPVSGSNLGTGSFAEGYMPVVIPKPGYQSQYYIFYAYSNGLRYSLLDMSLNNGSGAIVTGQKDITITTFGSVVPQKMEAIQGCDGIWLVIRSRVANQYFSFHITVNGIDTSNKVISDVGNFSLYDYSQTVFGQLKASPEGTHLAFCGWAGVELYDFEKCSGKVKNARVLEATGNLPLGPSNIFNHTRYNGICFSPDGSKLYVTFNQKDSTFIPSQNVAGGFITAGGTGIPKPGKLFQYDLSQSTTSGIITSKTLILTNQPSIMEIGIYCALIVPNPLGEIKNGPDGRLYIDNGSYTCLDASNVPAGYNPGPGFHTIDLPNLAGINCSPSFNSVIVNSFGGNMGGDFYNSGDGGKSYLQKNIVSIPSPPDTVSGQIIHMVACFTDSLILVADSGGSCYRWDDGSTEKTRTIFQSGTYYVSYFKNCSYTTDTFHTEIIKLPSVRVARPSCPGMNMGKIIALDSSGVGNGLSYIWRTADSSIIRQYVGINGDSIQELDTGKYFIEIISPAGCDTILSAVITSLPKPEVLATPTDTMIRYGDSLLLQATGATLYTWFPSGIMDTATKQNPVARPLEPTLISVIGMNESGCEDTAYVKVDIDYNMPDFIPNAFSPNGDGLNDIFRIEGVIYQKVTAFKIFNRFGQLVFSAFDGQRGWDGTQNGKPCDAGTYYYFIQLDIPDGKRKTYKGDLTLIR